MASNQCWYYNNEQCTNVPDQGRYCKKHVKYCLTLYFRYKQHEALAQQSKKAKKQLYYLNLAVIDRMEFMNRCVPPQHRDEGHSKRIKDILNTIHRLESEIKPKVNFPTVEEGKVNFETGFFDSFLQTMEQLPGTKDVDLDFIKMREEELIELKQFVTSKVDMLWDKLQLLTQMGLAITPMTIMFFIDNTSPLNQEFTRLSSELFKELDYEGLYDLIEGLVLLRSPKLLHNLENACKTTIKDLEYVASDTSFVAYSTSKLCNDDKFDDSTLNVSYEHVVTDKRYESLLKRFDQLYAYAAPYFEKLVGGTLSKLICLRCLLFLPMTMGGTWTNQESMKEAYSYIKLNIRLSQSLYHQEDEKNNAEGFIKDLAECPNRGISWSIGAWANPHLYAMLQQDDAKLMTYVKLGFDHLWRLNKAKAGRINHNLYRSVCDKIGRQAFRLWLINWKEKPTIQVSTFCNRLVSLIKNAARRYQMTVKVKVNIDKEPKLPTFVVVMAEVVVHHLPTQVYDYLSKLNSEQGLVL